MIRRSPYGPWLDSAVCVSGYWFCTSATISHENEASNLARELKTFFQDISRVHWRLSHLSKIEISVKSWAYFKQILTQFPALAYRWFDGLPKGLRLLNQKTGSQGSFRGFLDGDEMPYFSVRDFSESHFVSEAVDFPTIEALLDELLDKPQGALLISGVGGVGKTRMALEIGRTAIKKNILTITVSPSADDDAISGLASEHLEPADAIIIIDYAEIFDSLDKVVDIVDNLSALGHRFHLVATCRKSALSRIKGAMRILSPRVVILEDVGSLEGISYPDWVVQEILGQADFGPYPGVANICRGFPVLAAFAVFMMRKNPAKFLEQFSTLSTDDSF